MPDDDAFELFPEFAGSGAPSVQEGVLPSQDIEKLIRAGRVHAVEPIEPWQIQPASLDLRLGSVAYRLQASFLPGRDSMVRRKLDGLAMAELDLTRPTVLEKGCVYLAPLMEQLRLPEELAAKANPKSTTGRLDVFTRLITDYGFEFERVPKGYVGPLYAEIVPRTFSIIVHPGLSLSQLRFIRKRALSSDSRLRHLDREEGLVYLDETSPGTALIRDGLNVSVSLDGDREGDVVAYRGKENTPLVDLRKVGHYEIDQFWMRFPVAPTAGSSSIPETSTFSRHASGCECLRSTRPRWCRSIRPWASSGSTIPASSNPGFGYGDRDITGTRAVLEVRAHETPFVIEHGQVVGRLVYSRVLDVPEKIYGKAIGSS